MGVTTAHAWVSRMGVTHGRCHAWAVSRVGGVTHAVSRMGARMGVTTAQSMCLALERAEVPGMQESSTIV